ncbi:hypothetical protein SLEP1_g46483 [Rubroshorea leprosula]|uniref:F-box domain-containing protein n=1 Tax=Rubroshorea leprosula TaxID=152421 RepID=A0AAV5LN42_9ROSI|nr:hypothetical protein SLEP1_g46483 [Rubroshorea leprosula]
MSPLKYKVDESCSDARPSLHPPRGHRSTKRFHSESDTEAEPLSYNTARSLLPPPLLPGEVIGDVLLKLPIKSLIRFGCVCKSWKSLMGYSSLVDKHLAESVRNPKLRVLLGCLNGFDHYRLKSCPLCSLFNELFVDTIDVVYPNWNFYGPTRVVGCCSKVMILNPALREFKMLPNCHSASGFVYDSCNNDYKVVTISLYSYRRMLRVRVYWLRTNSWRTQRCEFDALRGSDSVC